MDPEKLHKNYNTQPTIQEVFVRNTKNKNINKESKKVLLLTYISWNKKQIFPFKFLSKKFYISNEPVYANNKVNFSEIQSLQ